MSLVQEFRETYFAVSWDKIVTCFGEKHLLFCVASLQVFHNLVWLLTAKVVTFSHSFSRALDRASAPPSQPIRSKYKQLRDLHVGMLPGFASTTGNVITFCLVLLQCCACFDCPNALVILFQPILRYLLPFFHRRFQSVLVIALESRITSLNLFRESWNISCFLKTSWNTLPKRDWIRLNLGFVQNAFQNGFHL